MDGALIGTLGNRCNQLTLTIFEVSVLPEIILVIKFG